MCKHFFNVAQLQASQNCGSVLNYFPPFCPWTGMTDNLILKCGCFYHLHNLWLKPVWNMNTQRHKWNLSTFYLHTYPVSANLTNPNSVVRIYCIFEIMRLYSQSKKTCWLRKRKHGNDVYLTLDKRRKRWGKNSTADVYILQDKCSGTQWFSSDGSVQDSWWFIVVRHRGGKVWDSEWLLTWTPEWAALQEVQREKTSGGWRWRRGITPSWPAAPRDTHASLRIHNRRDVFTDITLRNTLNTILAHCLYYGGHMNTGIKWGWHGLQFQGQSDYFLYTNKQK